MGMAADQRIVIGRIVGVFGVKGWVKVESWTRPPENILDYPVWLLGRAGSWQQVKLVDGRPHNRGLVVQLADVEGQPWCDRDRVAQWIGCEIAVLRGQLPPPAQNEFYWVDLVGLEVEDKEGRSLGKVRELFETPAHDMLVVSGERDHLIPCVFGPIVLSVDIEAGRIRVDWNPDDVR